MTIKNPKDEEWLNGYKCLRQPILKYYLLEARVMYKVTRLLFMRFLASLRLGKPACTIVGVTGTQPLIWIYKLRTVYCRGLRWPAAPYEWWLGAGVRSVPWSEYKH
jgi:hypothetical protein